MATAPFDYKADLEMCHLRRISALAPERGYPQPQPHRPRNTAQVFGDPPPRGRAAAGDSRAPALSQGERVRAGKAT